MEGCLLGSDPAADALQAELHFGASSICCFASSLSSQIISRLVTFHQRPQWKCLRFSRG